MKENNPGIAETKKHQVLFKILLVFLGLLIGFLCIEGGLRIAEALKVDWLFFATEGINSYLRPDTKLGTRVEPNAPGHDAKGFRNKSVPEKVDIVAIGDSQTWGVNARMAEAWPQQLAKISGHSVYNMSLGFYNPVEYWALTEESLEFSPKVIVIGLYFGNDIWGAYNRVYTDDTYAWLRAAEAPPDTVLPQILDVTTEWGDYSSWLEKSAFARIGSELTKRFRTFRLLWKSWRVLNDSQFKENESWALANPDLSTIYQEGKTTNILGPGYRLPSIDMDSPVITEGMRITKELLVAANAEAKESNARLIVLLIPIQESVYAGAVEKTQGQLTPIYEKMIEMETRARNDIIALLDENGIPYADALPALMEAVERGEKIYPREINGHPLAQGYTVIASVVNEKLDQLGWDK